MTETSQRTETDRIRQTVPGINQPLYMQKSWCLGASCLIHFTNLASCARKLQFIRCTSCCVQQNPQKVESLQQIYDTMSCSFVYMRLVVQQVGDKSKQVESELKLIADPKTCSAPVYRQMMRRLDPPGP